MLKILWYKGVAWYLMHFKTLRAYPVHFSDTDFSLWKMCESKQTSD